METNEPHLPNDRQDQPDDLPSGPKPKPHEEENPYRAVIRACNDSHNDVQALYHTHRERRNTEQRKRFLAAPFTGLVIDQHLRRLVDPSVQPGFRDLRNCLVLWARPPEHILVLAVRIQDMLKKTAPDLWLMPPHRMHLTTLEVAFSRTPAEISALVTALRPAIPAIVSHTYRRRARLVKPMVSHDLSACALSFLPASGEPTSSCSSSSTDDDFTYHHLRSDVFDMVGAAGVPVDSRYQVPSAHVTLGRYLSDRDHDTAEKRRAWVDAVDEVNAWLACEVWGCERRDRVDGDGGDGGEGEPEMVGEGFAGEWIVGQERGLDARCGAVWYGGGRSILVGEGF